MQERDRLMKNIQMYDFFLVELNLFLDTHPRCREALDYFRKYNEMKKAACEEYARLYGPLTISQAAATDSWAWVEGPWPWEKGE
ncbi:MAG: spore coat protein CotJB [Oscillospiraceae bacterium]